MKILLIALAVTVVLFLAAIKMAGTQQKHEMQEDPCETCLRWEECNGVDENCPWRAEDGK